MESLSVMPFPVTSAADGKNERKNCWAAAAGSYLWNFDNTTHDLSHTQQRTWAPVQLVHIKLTRNSMLAAIVRTCQ